MKRRYFLMMPLLLLLITCCKNSIAKNSDTTSAFNAGIILLSAGYGYPSKYLSLSGTGYQYYFDNTFSNRGFSGIGTFYLKGEYGLSHKTGIGFSVDYDNLDWVQILPNSPNYVPHYPQDFFTVKESITSFSVFIRYNNHYAATEKIDLYFAIGMGSRNTTTIFTGDNPYSENPPDITSSKFAFEAVAGLRYYCCHNFGIYTEVGLAKSIIQIGVSYKF